MPQIDISQETYDKVKDQILEEENKVKENKVKEKQEKKFEIRNRWTDDVIYSSSKTTYKDSLEEAISKDASLKDTYLKDAYLYHVKFYGKGGKTRIKKEQINDFLTALGVIVKN